MMNHANVAVAPGTGFSEEGEGYLRLALVENEERLKQAVRQMKKAMENMDVYLKRTCDHFYGSVNGSGIAL